jgi:N-acetylated-alpha-linked acidic dipeptidase
LSLLCSLLLAALALPPTPPAAPEPPLRGFSPAHAAAERALEARLDAALRPEDQRRFLERLAARPHPVGSPWGKENAEYMAGLFRSWGFDTRIEEFRVLFPTPRRRLLEMLAPTRFTAVLAEPPLAEDRTSNQTAEQLPVYNAFSPDGDVTADLVYVNHGVAADYAELARYGIDVRGKIVLARYGGSYRGMKPRLAAEHGAIGCLLFSDPHDDGYFQGDPYPAGGLRPEQGAQRGSVSDPSIYSGDPLTPGVGATPEAKRLPREEAPTLPRIPVLPLSWGDALPLLKALGGPMAPAEWRGALPVPYHLGPGPARVHLALAFDWKLVPAYDVIARLAGSERPEEWILRGNHHDAWVNGAYDPVSGIASVLGEAKAVGELAKTGWRPKRTLLYAAWDGEEAGLLGAVEWAETHAAELKEHLVAYLNSDGNARGTFYGSGAPSLSTLAFEACRDVTDPEKGGSVLARLRASTILYGSPAEAKRASDGRMSFQPLGTGVDYTPFLSFLGVAAVDISYGGEEEYGVYHSIYDSIDHFERFVDPGFLYGVALAQTSGRMMLRLADADVLPFDFVPYAETLKKVVQDLAQRTEEMRREAVETNRRLAERTYELADDPRHPLLPPPAQEPVPPLDFAPLQKAVAQLAASAQGYGAALEKGGAGGASLDRILLQAERALTRPEGLPGRPWYRHLIFGPVTSTGGMRPLPGVREAIEQRRWPEAAEQIGVAARAIEAFALEVDRAAGALGSSSHKIQN